MKELEDRMRQWVQSLPSYASVPISPTRLDVSRRWDTSEAFCRDDHSCCSVVDAGKARVRSSIAVSSVSFHNEAGYRSPIASVALSSGGHVVSDTKGQVSVVDMTKRDPPVRCSPNREYQVALGILAHESFPERGFAVVSSSSPLSKISPSCDGNSLAWNIEGETASVIELGDGGKSLTIQLARLKNGGYRLAGVFFHHEH